MTLPRFRLRTLMIAVAVAGIVLWAATSVDLPYSEIVMLGFLSIVPLIGAWWCASASNTPFGDAIFGGFASGMLEAIVLVVICLGRSLPLTAKDLIIFKAVAFLLLGGCVLGAANGLLVGTAFRLASSSSKARPPDAL